MALALITGANRGIGLELARQLKARGDEVVAACRTASPALKALGVRVEEGVDVTRPETLEALAGRLEGATLDLLIANAGILELTSLDDLDFDSVRRQFEVNAMGPLRTVVALRAALGEGSKIGIVTSRMGSVSDNDSGGGYGYRMSKTAVNMAGKSLAIDLRPDGIAVALLHPGWVRTEMTGNNGLIDAEDSAAGLLARLDALTLESSGSFWHQNGERLPW